MFSVHVQKEEKDEGVEEGDVARPNDVARPEAEAFSDAQEVLRDPAAGQAVTPDTGDFVTPNLDTPITLSDWIATPDGVGGEATPDGVGGEATPAAGKASPDQSTPSAVLFRDWDNLVHDQAILTPAGKPIN